MMKLLKLRKARYIARKNERTEVGMKEQEKKLLLIDTYSILYRAYHGSAKNMSLSDGTPIFAVYIFMKILLRFLELVKPSHILFALDKKGKTFRHHIYEDYKSTRKPMPEDLSVQIPYLMKFLEKSSFPHLGVEGYEADDVIGSVSHWASKHGFQSFILTGDRDDLQLLEEKVHVLYPERMGNYTHYTPAVFEEKYGFPVQDFVDYKALLGDSSDNIPGVKGIGEVIATKLIKAFKNLENLYQKIDEILLSEGIEGSDEEKNRSLFSLKKLKHEESASGLSSTVIKKLVNDKEMAFYSRKLSKIYLEIPATWTEETLLFPDTEVSQLFTYLKELHFHSILEQFYSFEEERALLLQARGKQNDLQLDGGQKKNLPPSKKRPVSDVPTFSMVDGENTEEDGHIDTSTSWEAEEIFEENFSASIPRTEKAFAPSPLIFRASFPHMNWMEKESSFYNLVEDPQRCAPYYFIHTEAEEARAYAKLLGEKVQAKDGLSPQFPSILFLHSHKEQKGLHLYLLALEDFDRLFVQLLKEEREKKKLEKEKIASWEELALREEDLKRSLQIAQASQAVEVIPSAWTYEQEKKSPQTLYEKNSLNQVQDAVLRQILEKGIYAKRTSFIFDEIKWFFKQVPSLQNLVLNDEETWLLLDSLFLMDYSLGGLLSSNHILELVDKHSYQHAKVEKYYLAQGKLEVLEEEEIEEEQGKRVRKPKLLDWLYFSALPYLPALYQSLLDKFKENISMHSFMRYVDLPLHLVVSEMEKKGIKVKREKLQELHQSYTEEIAQLEATVMKRANKPFNLNSPTQLAHFLYEDLKLPKRRKKKTSTAQKELDALRSIDPVIELIERHRFLQKIDSTFLQSLLANSEDDGRVHSHFHLNLTNTGRLSSSHPNLQNIPIKEEEGLEIRSCFVSEKGKCLLIADYSQIELRILAHMAEDETMKEAFLKKLDIHSQTAQSLFGKSDISADERRIGKTINFSVIYGISKYSLSKDLHIGLEEAQNYIQAYYARYRKIAHYMEDVVHQGKIQGYVQTLFGRRRYVPEFKSENGMVKQFAERVAMNTPIQGTAADLIRLAMIRVAKALEREKHKSFLILQVHDELLLEVDETEVQEVSELLKRAMEEAFPFEVPLIADVKKVYNWKEAK